MKCGIPLALPKCLRSSLTNFISKKFRFIIKIASTQLHDKNNETFLFWEMSIPDMKNIFIFDINGEGDTLFFLQKFFDLVQSWHFEIWISLFCEEFLRRFSYEVCKIAIFQLCSRLKVKWVPWTYHVSSTPLPKITIHFFENTKALRKHPNITFWHFWVTAAQYSSSSSYSRFTYEICYRPETYHKMFSS